MTKQHVTQGSGKSHAGLLYLSGVSTDASREARRHNLAVLANPRKLDALEGAAA